ncbi:MAG: cysteine synthase, partial [Acidobacteria bacterium]
MNVVEAIGRTPLFELGRIAAKFPGVRILAKA